MKDELFSIEVDSQQEFSLDEQSIKDLDLVKTPHGAYHVIHDSRSYEIKVQHSDFQSKSYVIEINGEEFTVQIKDRLDLLIDKMGLSKGALQQVDAIHAPMPGLILDLMVKKGDVVEENDALLILEAMKMENIIKSPRKGTIRSVAVKKGDAIDKNALLIHYE